MTHFQALLDRSSNSTPGEEQERASRRLPEAVNNSKLHWWTKKLPATGKALLLVIAPYSHYDLALLDVLDATLRNSTKQLTPIYVANLQQYETVNELAKDIPIITQAPLLTPIAALWVDGLFSGSATGKHARGFAAKAIVMSPETLESQVIERVPKYLPSQAIS
ncbi:MAG: hypothetical protein K2R98_24405 [Gemmataceae bacterium]|nr:hypothetical protein [Gemmataceae bacterium]